MKSRIKHVEGLGYFAQIKKGFFSSWKTLGCHMTGYGLYPEKHLEHPVKDEAEARAILNSYFTWLSSIKNKPTYTEVKHYTSK